MSNPFGINVSEQNMFGKQQSSAIGTVPVSSLPSVIGCTTSSGDSHSTLSSNLLTRSLSKTDSQLAFGHSCSQQRQLSESGSKKVFFKSGSQPTIFGQSGFQQPVFGQSGSQQTFFDRSGSQPTLFGGQNVSQLTLFGQTSSQHTVSGQNSFGQNKGAFVSTGIAQNQSDAPQNPFQLPSSVFGQVPGADSGQINTVFGQAAEGQTNTKTTADANSHLAVPMIGSTTTAFAASHRPALTSSFGQDVTFVQNSSITTSDDSFMQHSTSAFGKPFSSFSQQSSVFQVTSASNTSNAGSSENTTIKESTACALFGKTTPNYSNFVSQTAFGMPSVNGFEKTSLTSMEGQNNPPAYDTAKIGLFGKALTTSFADVRSSQTSSLFGKPAFVAGGVQSTRNPLLSTVGNQPMEHNTKTIETQSRPLKDDIKADTIKPKLFSGTKIRHEDLLVAAQQRGKQRSMLEGAKTEKESRLYVSQDDNTSEARVRHDNQFGKPSVDHGQPESEKTFKNDPVSKQSTTLFEKDVTKEGISENLEENAHKVVQTSRVRNPSLRGRFTASRQLTSRVSCNKEDSWQGDEHRPSLRRQISDDINSKVAILCKNVPEKLNNYHFLQTHFGKFGTVSKVFPNKHKMQATIHFQTHEDAQNAKIRGRSLAKGENPVTIFWSSSTVSATPKAVESSSEKGQRSSLPQKRPRDDPGLPKSKRVSWQTSGIKDELESMLGTQDTRGPVSEFSKSPEKRARSLSPSPSVSSVEMKPSDAIRIDMFEGVVARTTNDRVHLLDLRDKYIRQYQVRQKKDMKSAKAFVGICPDMCPEKERYDREDKRRLSMYEILSETENISGKNPQVDHSKAVKEYIRPSPDQDEPLPHELRPVEVLQATMTYLLSQVVDQGKDGYWADWFDFLWNRTRGIRKDITQQQLCNQATVDLIEKCTRFHIYCSERLSEEDMHSFDAKINNENLTKCLQTLRELYYDLELKQKIFCQNEAEFRAYTVLMNLNEGDILREVQQLRAEVRTSPAIRFALQAYFAVNSNNYVKFFQLVKKTTFTNACIMHRYFTQVRNKALVLMMKGYNFVKNKPTQIPLCDLVQILCFESESEASDFCQHFGFLVTNCGELVLDKTKYIEPETAWAPRRAVNLIESRLKSSVGELINGGPFSHTGHLIPKSSFDESGHFFSAVDLPQKGPAEAKQDQHSDVKFDSTTTEIKQGPSDVQAPKLDSKLMISKISQEGIKDAAKFLFWEVIDELAQLVAIDVKYEVDVKLQNTPDIVDSLILTTVHDELQTLSGEVYTEARVLKEKALQIELQQQLDRVAVSLTDDLVYDLAHQEALCIATIQMREVQEQLRKECMERVTEDISKVLLGEVIINLVGQTASDVYDVDVTQRLKFLEDTAKVVEVSRAAKFWKRWKKEFIDVTKLKRGMEQFPCTPCMDKMENQVNALIHVDDKAIHDKQFYINKRARLTIETPVEIDQRRMEMESHVLVQQLYRQMLYRNAWQPLHMSKVVGRHLIGKISSREQFQEKHQTLYWKLLLCLPTVDKDSTLEHIVTHNLSEWLTAKLSKGTPPNNESNVQTKVISLYRCEVNEEMSKLIRKPLLLGVCVRTLHRAKDDDDISAIEEDRLLLGTCAIMYVLPACAHLHRSHTYEYQNYWSKNAHMLKSIFEVNPMYQKIPLVLVLPVTASQNISKKEVLKALSLDDLLEQEHLCDVRLMLVDIAESLPSGIDFLNPQVSEKLCESLQWLAEHTRPEPDLCVVYLRDLIEKALLEHFYTPMKMNLKQRKFLRHPDQSANSLLELYNAIVSHIACVLTSHSLRRVSWPVKEFFTNYSSDIPPSYWNRDDHLKYICNLVQSLTLPEFVPEDVTESEKGCDLKRDVWTYMTDVVGRDFSGVRIKLFSRLKKLLRQAELDFKETCLFECQENVEPYYINVPWSKVVCMCIDYKLDSINWIDPESLTQVNGHPAELQVAYIEREMNSFVPPMAWKYPESEKSVLDSPSIDDTVLWALQKVEAKCSLSESKMEIAILDDPDNIPDTASDTRAISSHLMDALKSERRDSDHFQKYLEIALSSSGNVTSFTPHEKCMDLSKFDGSMESLAILDDSQRLSFDPTNYFNPSMSGLSHIFHQQSQKRLSLPPSVGLSDTGLYELTGLSRRKRQARLSCTFNNDPVMMYLNEPSMLDEVKHLTDDIKASRRDSDLFEKRLKLILQHH